MSTPGPSTSELSALPAGVSHLLAADEVMNPGWRSICITLCGEDVHVGGSGVIPVEHCPGCECVPRFCPRCVQNACQWSTES